ncbi:transcriptional regulator, TetR family [Parafrankia sp. EUN1f]|nr:transcriptional regulator, TetR family [Parafrankia sp. EUN1f]
MSAPGFGLITGTLRSMASPAVPPSADSDGLDRPAQRARRERILDAAVALGSEGGYDAVQMRAVAERSGVALGTLYRYFPSKVQLLVSAMAREIDGIRLPSAERMAGLAPADRILTVLSRATKVFQRDPNLAGALVRAVMFADASATAEVDQVTQRMNSIIIRMMRGEDGDPSPRDIAVAGLIAKVWFVSEIQWLSGRTKARQVIDDLELVVRELVH